MGFQLGLIAFTAAVLGDNGNLTGGVRMSAAKKCMRCGRRMRWEIETDGQEWNVLFVHGFVSGIICPGCQTAAENAEAVINEATGASTGGWSRTDPQAYLEHIEAVANDVYREGLTEVASSGGGVAADPHLLADQTMDKLRRTIGLPTQPDPLKDVPEGLVQTFRSWLYEDFGRYRAGSG